MQIIGRCVYLEYQPVDLNRVLQDVIDKYGQNEDYPVPDIVWSDRKSYSIYGEYQYWNNRIVVNRLLNNRRVSYEALKSVIYHEYTHQVISDHNEEFNAHMSRFPHYDEYGKQLDEVLNDAYNELLEHQEFLADNYSPSDVCNDLPLSVEEETLVVEVRHDDDDPESYEQLVECIDGFAIGQFYKMSLPVRYDNRIIPQVIFTVVTKDDVFAVGWAKNVCVHSHDREIDLSKYLNFESPRFYQFKCKLDNFRWLLSTSSFPIFVRNDIPASFKRSRACMLSEFADDIGQKMIDIINSYDGGFHRIGISEDAIERESPILMTDAKRIRLIAKKETPKIALWLLNKAVNLEPSFESYKQRAEIHDVLLNLVYSIDDYRRCAGIMKSKGIPCSSIQEKIRNLTLAHAIINEDYPDKN